MLLTLTACGGSGGSAALPAAVATLAPVPVLVSLGDSITYGCGPTHCIPGVAPQPAPADSYPSRLGGINLGIPGEYAICEPTKRCVEEDEVREIPSNASVVTLFIGTNDETGIVFSHPNAAGIANYTQAYKNSLVQIVSEIRTRVPTARVIVATLPNLAYSGLSTDLATRQVMSDVNQAFNQVILNLGADGIVDLECLSIFYDPTFMTDSIHPNDRGYAAVAAAFKQVITGSAPVPPATCAWTARP